MGNEKQMCGLTWHQPQTVPPVPLTFYHTGVKPIVPEQTRQHGESGDRVVTINSQKQPNKSAI